MRRPRVTIDDVRRAFGLADEPWLRALDGLAPTGDATLPDPAAGRDLLRRLQVPELDAAELLATWPSPQAAPHAWWLIERLHAQLVSGMGDPSAPPLQFGPLPRSDDPALRWLPVHAYLAAIPAALAYHRLRRIPASVSWATFADLGRHIALERRTTGRGGIDAPYWPSLHFRGLLFELGRLQFNRGRICPGPSGPGPWFWYDADAAERLGTGFREGDFAAGIHIPDGGGLTPSACDRALSEARSFFDRHFPDEPMRIATCTSWLLDPQLADHLPAQSNIIQFQRRFELVPGAIDADADVVRFVFRRPSTTPIDELPQGTTLERAAVTHLRAGHHWELRTGWLLL